MKEYIEREILQKAINTEISEHAEDAKESLYKRGYNNGLMMAYALLLKAPAADVVEVVRCKDCDVPHNKWIGCRYLNGLIPPPDFYCAYGKRKIDKEE